MARTPKSETGRETAPQQFAEVPPPRDLYATSDIRFVMTEVGKLTANVDHLISNVGKLSDKLTALNTSVDRFKTSIWVVAACLAIFLPLLGGLLWWSVGERINSMLKPSVVSSTPLPLPPKP